MPRLVVVHCGFQFPLRRAEHRSSVRIKELWLFECSEFHSSPHTARSAGKKRLTGVFFWFVFFHVKENERNLGSMWDRTCDVGIWKLVKYFHNPHLSWRSKLCYASGSVNISHHPFTSFTRDTEVTELSFYFFNQEKKWLKKPNDSFGINGIIYCSWY